VAPAPDAALAEGTIDIVDAQGGRHPVALATLDSALPGASMAAVLAPVGPYGRVLEIIGGDDRTAALLAALAPRLGALPWRTPGRASVLQQLRGATLEAQARTAVKCAAAAGAGDIAFLDVAACLSGVTPAWTGGPLTWLWAGREKLVPAFDAGSRDAWNRLQPALHRAFA
jgi:3-hydroxyacyl-CoA dehydrogenase/enoyl-CoA hydratase/3-hydroxybutyryl-CoA epimerase